MAKGEAIYCILADMHESLSGKSILIGRGKYRDVGYLWMMITAGKSDV